MLSVHDAQGALRRVHGAEGIPDNINQVLRCEALRVCAQCCLLCQRLPLLPLWVCAVLLAMPASAAAARC